tara:strand:+ start:762 stop:1616 length:855 start_codon:yes stop_codon:yes gene_type:complete
MKSAMKNKLNQHGLSRPIPPAVKLEVRQRCGFGCVSCGRGIIQYDHFDPEYADAMEHNAKGITLLCGSCHDEKKHGLLTNAQVAKMDADPYCMRNENAFGAFRLTGDQPIVLLGNSEFRQCKIILEVAGEKVIWFTKPRQADEGFYLNARIRDETGKVILEIRENEWIIGDDLWDVNTSGNGIVIRSRARNHSLILRFLPPETVKIERVSIAHKGVSVRIEKDGRIIDANNNTFSNCAASNCHTGIRFRAAGSIAFGCGRPRSLNTWIRLRLSSALVPVKTLAS